MANKWQRTVSGWYLLSAQEDEQDMNDPFSPGPWHVVIKKDNEWQWHMTGSDWYQLERQGTFRREFGTLREAKESAEFWNRMFMC